MMNDWVVDTETFPNVFLAGFRHVSAPLSVPLDAVVTVKQMRADIIKVCIRKIALL